MLLSLDVDLVVEIIIHVRLSRIICRCRRRCCRLYSLTVTSSALLRRRNADPKSRLPLTAELRHRRERDDALAGPAFAGVAERPGDRPVVDAVENKAASVVGEPHNKLSFLVLSDANFFFRY